jgi:hypothetical protein
VEKPLISEDTVDGPTRDFYEMDGLLKEIMDILDETELH